MPPQPSPQSATAIGVSCIPVDTGPEMTRPQPSDHAFDFTIQAQYKRVSPFVITYCLYIDMKYRTTVSGEITAMALRSISFILRRHRAASKNRQFAG